MTPISPALGGSDDDTLFLSRLLAPDPVWQALGGARAVTGSGLSATMGNPATATSLEASRAGFSHLVWAGDLSREWIGMGAALGSKLHFSADAGLLHGPELEGFDPEGRSTGNFDASEWNAGGTLAGRIGSGWDLGLGFRFFRLEDPEEPVSGLGFSAGARWQFAGRILGLSVTDLGSDPDAGIRGTFSLPTRWRVGVEQPFLDGSLGAISLESGPGQDPRIRFGLEIRPTPWIRLLGGIRSKDGQERNALGWSTGFSVEREGIVGSYAFYPAAGLTSIHQFGVEIPLQRASK